MAEHTVTVTFTLTEEQYQKAAALVDMLHGEEFVWDTPEKLMETLLTTGSGPLIDQRLAAWEEMTLEHITGQRAAEGTSQ